MGKSRLCIFILIAFFVQLPLKARAEAKSLVVLVPGFLNRWIPSSPDQRQTSYFSKAIIQTIHKENYPVYVAQSLDPLGSLELNSSKLVTELRQLKSATKATSLILIGHSLGGLLSLYASQYDDLNIQKVVTISTPFLGVDLVEKIDSTFPWILRDWIDYEILKEMKPERVKSWMSQLKVPDRLQVLIAAGWQSPCFLDCRDPRKLSFVLTLTDYLAGSQSDGMVRVESAVAPLKFPQMIPTRSGQRLKGYKSLGVLIPLEHWEMILEHQYLSLMGTRETEWVESQQILMMQRILRSL